jgi:hypothetical protein
MTTASSTTNGIFSLIGSFASFFDTLTLYSNNVPIEQIFNYSQIFNFMLNTTVNTSEKYGSWSVSSVAETDSNLGLDLPQQTGTFTFNFSIPLLSIIGLNLANTSNKLLPVGSIGHLMLRMTTAQQLPFGSYCSAVITQPVYTVALDSFNLNMSYVNIGDTFGNMLR